MPYSRTGLGFACPPPLVWAANYRRCMNADDPRVTSYRPAAGQSAVPDSRAPIADGGELLASAAQQGVPFAQLPLSAEARAYFAERGVSVDCRIDQNWFTGPQGGDPAMLCSVNGSPYEHAAYALNLNPSVALPDAMRGPVQSSAVPSTPSYTPAPVQTTPTPSSNYTSVPATPTTPTGAGQPTAPPSGTTPAPASPYTFTPPALPAVLTDEFISGVPNWALAAVGAFVVYKAL